MRIFVINLLLVEYQEHAFRLEHFFQIIFNGFTSFCIEIFFVCDFIPFNIWKAPKNFWRFSSAFFVLPIYLAKLAFKFHLSKYFFYKNLSPCLIKLLPSSEILSNSISFSLSFFFCFSSSSSIILFSSFLC